MQTYIHNANRLVTLSPISIAGNVHDDLYMARLKKEEETISQQCASEKSYGYPGV